MNTTEYSTKYELSAAMQALAKSDEFEEILGSKLEIVETVFCEKTGKPIRATEASLVASRTTGEWWIFSFEAADESPHLYAMPIASMQTLGDLVERGIDLTKRPWFEHDEFLRVAKQVYFNL